MDATTIKIVVLGVLAVLILATLAGEFWLRRRRHPRPPVGRMQMVREDDRG